MPSADPGAPTMSRLGLLLVVLVATLAPRAQANVTREEVERAINRGVRYLKDHQQRAGGAWPGQNGTTALVTLALLTAGERPDSPSVAQGLKFLEGYGPEQINNTYAVGLQTMALAAADPRRYAPNLARNANWLERTQLGNRFAGMGTVGSWSYPSGNGDNSNTQYALHGLQAAREAGIPINPQVWARARDYFRGMQARGGGWGYDVAHRNSPTASMTCAGISSLIIAELNLVQTLESFEGDRALDCGRNAFDPALQRGVDWLAANFRVDQNLGEANQWKYYYLYGLERVGRLTGLRYLGEHDWYREGAQELVKRQDTISGAWNGDIDPIVTTSFALLFLAKGRSPVLINKLRHGPGRDWDNDRDDVRNLVGTVSRDWDHLLTWQVVDPTSASVDELRQAPILYFNGHEAPVFGPAARKNLREYVEQGGFLFAEACCGRPEFDKGFRDLMEDLFPEPEHALHPLSEDHAVWRAKHMLSPEVHPLWGVEHGCRTVVIYSPGDLSCGWNLSETQGAKPPVIRALRVGQNVVDYATGREIPADKLSVRDAESQRLEPPRRGALHIAKLRHGGEWNIAPLAVPHLTSALREGPLKFDVVVNHREIAPRDPNLVNFPLVYLHGRAAVSFAPEEIAALRRHLAPGDGTLFADAACGGEVFDASFRKLAAELLPDHPLVPIPTDDPLYGPKVGYDLADVQYGRALGGKRGFPTLEGAKVDGHWAIIYSKYDLGCAMESQQGPDCKGYSHESALKIAANIVIYSTLPW